MKQNDLKSYEKWKAEKTKELVDGAKAVSLLLLLAILVVLLSN